MQWPDNEDYSLQFMRVLGSAQEGGSTVSECFLAASRIVPGDDESWDFGLSAGFYLDATEAPWSSSR